jgi:hypothetical protein
MKKILLDNAYESWTAAIKISNSILEGNLSLQNRKYFVNSLHNAVELFVKQIMLNNNDHRVALIKDIKKINSAGSPLIDYYKSNDLNSFFYSCSQDIKKKFCSIEFNMLIDLINDVLSDFITETDKHITNELKLLASLRNNETHFDIDKNGFLNEDEFKKLYNFMIVFYEIIQFYHLLPSIGQQFDEHKQLEFVRTKLTDFSYLSTIKKSAYVNQLKSLISVEVYWGNPTDTPYNIADCLYNTINTIPAFTDFNTLLDYINTLYMYNLINIDGGYEEIKDEYGCLHEVGEFYIDIKI